MDQFPSTPLDSYVLVLDRSIDHNNIEKNHKSIPAVTFINSDWIGVYYKHLIGLLLIYRAAFGCVDPGYIYHGLDVLFINIYCASQ